MNQRFAAFLIVLAAAFSPVVHAGGKADKKASVTVHLETEGTDNPKMVFQQDIGGRTRYFHRVPEVATKDIMSFSPFPSEAGNDYGAVFKLRERAARRLSAITNANQGRWMITMVNGRAVDGVVVDKQIDDGIVVAWKGINMADIAVLDDGMPRIGEQGGEKKKLEKE